MDALPDLVAPGTPIGLDNCDREPLHLTGAIQPHGVLVVCATTPPHAVVQRAGDLPAVPGLTLTALVGADAAAALVAGLDRPGPPGLRPLRVQADGLLGGVHDAVVYRPAADRVAVELEPAETAGAADPAGPAAVARRHPGELLGALAPPPGSGAGDVEALLGRAVLALRELTGYDRVWAYRFESDGHGVVVAEDGIEGLDRFLGLHYPASDIPAPARALFLRNAVRVIADVEAEPAPVVPGRDPVSDAHLDLSDSALRAVSPMHIHYLQAMGVRASLSVAIVVDGALWGLLSAHHYAAPSRPSAWVRADCELLGQMVSMQLRALEEVAAARERLAHDGCAARVLDTVAGREDIGAGLVADADALLGICAADGAVVCLGGVVRTAGAVAVTEAQAGALVAALADGPQLVARDTLDGLDGGAGPDGAAGALVVALSPRGRDWILWLRRPWTEEVRWAHRPKELVGRRLGEPVPTGPEGSYENWARAAAGRSRPWSAAQQQAAADFRGALGTLVLARAAELAELNAELRRSNDDLDAFAFAVAHDLQEPVRSIRSFATFVAHDHGAGLPEDGRAMLGTIVDLADRTSGLLTGLLEFSRAGRERLDLQPVVLSAALGDVRTLLHKMLADHGARLVIEQDGTLCADPLQLEQLLVNLVSNAVKYGGPQPVVRVAVHPEPDPEAERPRVRLTVADDGIGIDPEHHEAIFAMFRRLHPRAAYGGGSGVGLAIARTIVERHGGTIGVTSAPGAGTRMTCTLPGQA